MQLKLILPTLTAVTLLFLPTRSVKPEPTIAYATFKPIKTLALPSLPAISPVEYQPLPVAPQGTYINSYAFGNCTWYVAGRKKIPDSWGNAADWAGNAKAQGTTVSAIPIVGAIAQRTGGLGHVAIVLEVSGDEVLITEMNSAGFDAVDERWMPTSTYNYIYD